MRDEKLWFNKTKMGDSWLIVSQKNKLVKKALTQKGYNSVKMEGGVSNLFVRKHLYDEGLWITSIFFLEPVYRYKKM